MNVVDEGHVNALVDSLGDASASSASFVAINSSAILESRNRVLHHDEPSGGFLSFLKPLFRDAFGDGGKSESVLSTMRELYSRRSADDLLYSWVVDLSLLIPIGLSFHSRSLAIIYSGSWSTSMPRRGPSPGRPRSGRGRARPCRARRAA